MGAMPRHRDEGQTQPHRNTEPLRGNSHLLEHLRSRTAPCKQEPTRSLLPWASIFQPHRRSGRFQPQGLYTSPCPRHLSLNKLPATSSHQDKPINRQDAFADEKLQLWRPACGHTREHHKGHHLTKTGYRFFSRAAQNVVRSCALLDRLNTKAAEVTKIIVTFTS